MKQTSRCDKKKVAAFDYSRLDTAFAALGKPAQRALINNKIYSPRDLSQWTRDGVNELHGIGPSAFPVLIAALRTARLKFKP